MNTSSSVSFGQPRVVSPEEWLDARKKLLIREKELTRQRDALAVERRSLPWTKVQKNYGFDTPRGKQTLAELFEGRSQLAVYHFMFGPGWEEGCKSCSFLIDHLDEAVVHINARDVTFTAVSRAPLSEITPFKQRMGWTVPWASSFGSDFNRDYQVSFTPEETAKGNMTYNYGPNPYPSDEAHGLSLFAKNASGEVFHTYSSYARGPDILLGTYNLLDFVPKGRDEDGLAFSMEWIRHHDRYENNVSYK